MPIVRATDGKQRRCDNTHAQMANELRCNTLCLRELGFFCCAFVKINGLVSSGIGLEWFVVSW